jgi:PAS domain S-box-containing protein
MLSVGRFRFRCRTQRTDRRTTRRLRTRNGIFGRRFAFVQSQTPSTCRSRATSGLLMAFSHSRHHGASVPHCRSAFADRKSRGRLGRPRRSRRLLRGETVHASDHSFEDLLNRSETRLRALIEACTSTSVVWTTDAEGVFVEPQSSWEAYTGQPWEEHRGWGWTAKIHPDDRESVTAQWRKAVAVPAAYEAQARIWHHVSQTYRRCVSRAVPIANGSVREWVGTLTDVEDQHRAESALRDQTHVMATLNRVGTIVASELDRDKIVQTVTDAATELTSAEFGAFFYNVLDAETGDAFMLYTLSGASREAFAAFPKPRATALFGATFRGEGVVRIEDVLRDPRYGKSAPYHGMPPGHLPVRSYLAVPIKGRSGEVFGGLFFGHSQPGVFTEHHERLAVGIASWASVALENARLYRDAQDASRTKDEFLAVLSHELRTPLNAMLGWSRMLREHRVEDPEKIERALTIIERNARVQTQLVEDLLDVSRIVNGKLRLDLKPIHLTTIIESAVDGVRPAAANKDISFVVRLDDGASAVSGDADRLEQVVWNLLSNAVKFAPPGGRVVIELFRRGLCAEVTVTDDGQGIEPGFLPHVFERFRQGQNGTARKHGGLGLGLALVRALTEAHGGSVHAESAGVGQGAKFTIRLPLLHKILDPVTTSDGHARECRDLSGMRILILDDETDARELLSMTIEQCEAVPVAVPSVREALRLLHEQRPDLILADLGLPEQDGFDFIRIVRSLPEEVSRVPAIAVTAYASSDEREKALRAGYNAHVAKPVEPERLLTTIARVLRDETA